MKKAEHSFLTLTICVVAAMFIGLTVLACGKTTDTDLSSQPKTLTINNTTIYDLTDLHFICNNDSSSNEELSLVKAGSSETVELPRSFDVDHQKTHEDILIGDLHLTLPNQ